MSGYEVRVGETAPGVRVRVDPGLTVALADLPPYSLALDGVVQGPEFDLDNHRLSFDHHGNCVRMVTSATCRQVADAILLGLEPSAYVAYVNDVDGDTVMAVALLAHHGWLDATAAERDVVRRLVDAVGGRDAHGPAYPVAEPHLLAVFARAVPLPLPRAGASAEGMAGDLVRCVEAVVRLVGRLARDEPLPDQGDDGRETGTDFTITHIGTGWVMVSGEADRFDHVYEAGYLRAVLWRPLEDGTIAYTVGRRSDLVDAFPVGPADHPGTLLAALAAVEPGWGGGSSIGGAPRRPDGGRSRLTPDEVFAVVEAVVTGACPAG